MQRVCAKLSVVRRACMVRHPCSSSSASLLRGLASSSASLLPLPPLGSGAKRLYLARHGETDWNLQRRIQGRTIDQPLNANGLAQAAGLAQLLVGEPLELIVASPLRRAARTAQLMHEHHSDAAWRLEPRFEEMCFGQFEGRTLDEFETTYRSTLDAWSRGDLNVRWPGDGGESCGDVAKRALAGLRDLGLLDSPGLDAGATRHVLVVAHSRVNKSLIAALRGDLSRCSEVEQGNACLNVIDFVDGRAEVVLLDHTGDDGSTRVSEKIWN